MRIGFDAKKAVTNFTGIGNYSRRCLSALAEGYPEEQLLLFEPRHRNGAYIPETGNAIAVMPPRGLGHGLFYELWRNRLVCYELRRRQVDVFHGLSNEVPLGIHKSGIRSVVTIHDLIFLRRPKTYGWLARQILTYKTRYACRHADLVVAISEATKRDLMELYGVPESRIRVVYQSIDSVYWQPIDEELKAEVRQTYDLPARFVLCVGTVEQRKNQLLVVKALPALPQDVHFVVVGRATPYQDELLREARLLGVSPRLHVYNDVPTAHLPAFYQSAAVFCFMSEYEGFGLPVVEALASGTPVVAATGSCLEEAGGPDSLYVAPDDADGLQRAVNRILGSAELASDMSRKGQQYAVQFSDVYHGQALMRIYQSLMGRAHGGENTIVHV